MEIIEQYAIEPKHAVSCRPCWSVTSAACPELSSAQISSNVKGGLSTATHAVKMSDKTKKASGKTQIILVIHSSRIGLFPLCSDQLLSVVLVGVNLTN